MKWINNNGLKTEWCYLSQHSFADWIGHAISNPSSVVNILGFVFFFFFLPLSRKMKTEGKTTTEMKVPYDETFAARKYN